MAVSDRAEMKIAEAIGKGSLEERLRRNVSVVETANGYLEIVGEEGKSLLDQIVEAKLEYMLNNPDKWKVAELMQLTGEDVRRSESKTLKVQVNATDDSLAKMALKKGGE